MVTLLILVGVALMLVTYMVGNWQPFGNLQGLVGTTWRRNPVYVVVDGLYPRLNVFTRFLLWNCFKFFSNPCWKMFFFISLYILVILVIMIISYKEKCAIIFIHPVHLSMQKRVQFLLNCSVDFDETLLLFSEICSFIRHVRLQTDIAHV